MDDTRELISIPVFSRWLIVVAVVVFAIGIGWGWAWGRRKGTARAGLARGLAAGLMGPAALVLWALYNALEDHYGLDSVAALVMNLVIFIAAGAVAGTVLQRTWRATAGETASPSEGDRHEEN